MDGTRRRASAGEAWRTVIHELIHAIDGTSDLVDPNTGQPVSGAINFNDPKFDFLGQTVRKQNQIFQEMGWGPGYWQVGYDAIDTSPPMLQTGISYTEGNYVDIAYFGWNNSQTPGNLDLSSRTDFSNDLIIGDNSSEIIRGGTGNDYLYGGKGNDTISGGSGNNVIDGGLLGVSMATDGIDTADYSIGDFDALRPHGVTLSIDPASVPDRRYL